MINKKKNIKRGEIYICNLPFEKNSSIQYGKRPVLVIQNDTGNYFSPTTLVIPLTKQLNKHNLPTHTRIINKKLKNKISIALCEQIRIIDKKELKKYVCTISNQELLDIEKALQINFGILK